MSRPIVIIPCCTKVIEGHAFDAVGRKYSSAVAEVAECQPLLAPLGPSMVDMAALLEIADGILLSGSLSNVHPSLYGATEAPLNESALDAARDNLTLPLIREALNRKLPTFAICRGFQELNVALGGTLDQAVHTVSGRHDHRERSDVPLDDRFGPAHPVHLSGTLKDWVGMVHPVKADVGCRNTIYNSVPQSASPYLRQMIELGARWFRVELLGESGEETSTLIRGYREILEGRGDGQTLWRRLNAVSTLGVTRGPLGREE